MFESSMHLPLHHLITAVLHPQKARRDLGRTRSKGLTLEPVGRLVGEQGLAAGVTGEAAILDAESVELGELLAEHSAHTHPNGASNVSRDVPALNPAHSGKRKNSSLCIDSR